MSNELNYNVITISADAEREVEQDQISITFSTVQVGPDSAKVQEALVIATNAALEVARAHKKGNQVRVESTGMNVQPGYDKKGGISGYTGRSAIIVSGTDMKTISGLTSEISTMNVNGIDFSVSDALKKRILKKLTLEAIANFKEKTQEIAEAFGATGYTLINANVHAGTGGGRRVRGATAAGASFAMASAQSSVEVEGGKETLQASVSGSMQLV